MRESGFLDNIKDFPQESPLEFAFLEKLPGKISQDILENPKSLQLLAFIFAYSPFLSGLVIRNGDFFADICRDGADKVFVKLKQDLREFKPASSGDLMQKMRIAKG
ncbi:MAG: hypothetical protein WCL30_01500, partial [Pseudomonadota bacterium]